MKKMKLILILLFMFQISTNVLFANLLQDNYITNSLSSKLERNDHVDHLNLIFQDLISKGKFSTTQVNILNNYDLLKSIRLEVGNHLFVTVDKETMISQKNNVILFWRMDVSLDYAHYELYIEDDTNQTIKYDYKFEFINNQWLLKR